MTAVPLRIFIAALCMLAFQDPAHAWGREGHKIVGDIAEIYLSPEAHQAVARLLADDRLTNGKASGRSTLGEVASWPDEIRSVPALKHTKPWHFDGIPVCGAATPDKTCPGGNCASKQLARLAAVLRDGRGSLRAQNEALKWVVHLMGDIHQPLHTTDNADLGGNQIPVSFFGQTTIDFGQALNLHSTWDERIVSKEVESEGGAAVFVARPIDKLDLASWTVGSAHDWITESHAYAVSIAYGKLPAGYVCGAPAPASALDQAYYDQAAPIAALQLRRAGVRLAHVLNAAFASTSPEATGNGAALAVPVAHGGSAPHLPDPSKTPGRAAKRTARAVCGMPNTKDERHVTQATKKAVYDAYEVARCGGYCSGSEGCEVDHLISLELGGANTPDNLWPQPYQGLWNAHDKDRLENRLKAMVCKEKSIALAQAQAEVATDWISAYKKYIGPRKAFKAVRHCP